MVGVMLHKKELSANALNGVVNAKAKYNDH